ncbi:GtrA family protein [Microvirga sp. G4-2]|uniref:GtrA family protein n=1 Tax=Microvirga sp. G4-2 TaxID=3434467 RepID=UPI004043D3A8
MSSQHKGRDTARARPSSRSAGNTAGMFIRYVLFAILATLANLLTQEATMRLAPVAPLTLSILVGTVAGFILKYLLDKKWVFDDGYDGHKQELQKITLYGAFSILTTLVFWGFEIAFWAVWQTDFAKYSGAVLGLAVGYAAKFMLDRSFVFKERQA